MHNFTAVDPHILVGLFEAEQGVGISCLALVASCAEAAGSIPTSAEFAEAFNKFLYVSAITIADNNITLSDFGREIVEKVRRKMGEDARLGALMQGVLEELSRYKLKSMCNRLVWTQQQYDHAVNVQRNR